jgi:hypothetical protein
VKKPVNQQEAPPKAVDKVDTSYVWQEMGFFTSWSPSKTLILLCFNIYPSLKTSLSDFMLNPTNDVRVADPFTLHIVLVETIVELYDSALWAFRDIVRALEQVGVSLSVLEIGN